MTNAIDLTAANLETLLPVERLSKLELVAVDRYQLLDSVGDSDMATRIRAHIESLLPGGIDSWVRIGSVSEDQSYFCEFEGKWEYCHRDDVIFARKAELDSSIQEWNKSEENLTWKPFAGLGA